MPVHEGIVSLLVSIGRKMGMGEWSEQPGEGRTPIAGMGQDLETIPKVRKRSLWASGVKNGLIVL